MNTPSALALLFAPLLLACAPVATELGSEPDAGGAEDGGTRAADCFAAEYPGAEPFGPDYDPFAPSIGGHCDGTDHQDIDAVDRVVFLGDSITVGTPPTLARNYYRNKLAFALAERFDLEPPESRWWRVDPIDGGGRTRTSGGFSNCAEWGGRVGDFAAQLADCFPEAERDLRTLVVMTLGGNDMADIARAAIDGVGPDELAARADALISELDAGIGWLTEPGRFPAGVFVVFANVYEFTDGTGDTGACAASSLGGFTGSPADPSVLTEAVYRINEGYMEIAARTGTDLVFALERFCGHGFRRADPAAPCYRGAGVDKWFDLTCIHPNREGHEALGELFLSVISR